jgi:hypothetical protein
MPRFGSKKSSPEWHQARCLLNPVDLIRAADDLMATHQFKAAHGRYTAAKPGGSDGAQDMPKLWGKVSFGGGDESYMLELSEVHLATTLVPTA